MAFEAARRGDRRRGFLYEVYVREDDKPSQMGGREISKRPAMRHTMEMAVWWLRRPYCTMLVVASQS